MQYRTEEEHKNSLYISEDLLDSLRLILAVVEELEDDRQKWWTSLMKREQRLLEEEGDQKKLSQLHKINNETTERIEVMNAKLGTFVKSTLGTNGGNWELQEGHKVASANDY